MFLIVSFNINVFPYPISDTQLLDFNPFYQSNCPTCPNASADAGIDVIDGIDMHEAYWKWPQHQPIFAQNTMHTISFVSIPNEL